MSKVKFPFGAADVIAADAAAAIAVTISNNKTLLTISQMAAAGTLNLTIDKDVEKGAELHVRVSADGTNRVLTFGTGMTAVAHTNTASKTFHHTFVYDGSKFVKVAEIQLD